MGEQIKAIVAELRRLHGELDVRVVEGRADPAFVRAYKCPLDSYERRGLLSPDQYSAGLDFHDRYFQAFGRQGSVAGNYQPRVSGGKAKDYLDAGVWRYLTAFSSITGTRERSVCVRVCCYDLKAGDDMALLKSGLDDLARYFGRRPRRE